MGIGKFGFQGRLSTALLLCAVALSPGLSHSQTTTATTSIYEEDFTGDTTNNNWYFYTGACLTAGNSNATSTPNKVPSCATVKTNYYHENLVGGQNGAAGSMDTLPDTPGNGALRLTNGYISSGSGGYNQNGAIVAADTFATNAGVDITFKTVTYRGDSGGAGSDGADGISFFLMDGTIDPNVYSGVGAFGGSLGYTCSNTNNDPTLRPDGTQRGYDGLVGAYIGLGIDEYGNFLNPGDNTATGPGYTPGRIGLRGRGNISWKWLNYKYSALYPSTLSAANQALAVQKTCQTGDLWDFSSAASPSNTLTPVPEGDYAAIPNAYSVLPNGTKIANEYSTGGYARGSTDVNPILYKLQITKDGLLSFSYSYNGGAYQSVLTNQSITSSNGPLPDSFRFGFAGSSGGSTNIHEIMCFKAAPHKQSGSSTSVNERQSAKVDNGTSLAFFAYYDPSNWTGRLTANLLQDNAGVITVNPTAVWDASCVLTGVASGESCAATGDTTPRAAQGSANRVVLTYGVAGGSPSGVPFQWTNLTAAQQNAIDADATTGTDPTTGAARVAFLRGDRSNEVNSSGVGLFRRRDSVLADIVDSSPTWVGPPTSPYTGTWADRINGAASMPENSGSQNYLQFISSNQTRANVVYTGANDGLLHGFESGAFDSSGKFSTATTANDGRELLAYMPDTVLRTIHSATDPSIDYSGLHYGHNFYVDAPPGSGDLFYNGAWHTWLVGGLGSGGAAIYALDVTDPTKFTESSTNAANVVIGEWSSTTVSTDPTHFACYASVGGTGCASNLGNTYGTPQIRRIHNAGGSGKWAVIFGNGYKTSTSSGDAGIYVMAVDSAGAKTFYYLSTGSSGNNGIAYVAPADLDGDHITDYVYAGDVKGNLWRFDLTGDLKSWSTATGVTLLYSNPGQPITTKPVIASVPVAGSNAPRLIIAFGTGQRYPLTNTTPTTYASGSQSIYGVWDWNMASWNSQSVLQYQSLAATTAATGLQSSLAEVSSNLQQQPITVTGSGARVPTSSTPICWKSPATCGGGNDNKFGWYINLPGSQEQIVYNPLLYQGALIVDSTVPSPPDDLLSCSTSLDSGYTYIVKVDSGSNFTGAFVGNTETTAVGVKTNATGTPYVVTTTEGTTSLVYQTISGDPNTTQISLPSNVAAQRLTWVELR